MVVTCLAAVAQPWQLPADAADLALPACVVKHVDDVQLPAMEAGALVQLSVKEGSQVREGDVIGKIYDSEAQMQRKAAESDYAAAVQRWKNDVPVRYAEAAAEVAKKDWEMMLESNKLSAKAVPEIEVIKKELEWKVTKLQIEKAQDDQVLAKYDAYAKQAQRDAANLALERRTIRALFDGEVVELLRHQGEWVNPGDPILRLVSLETMWVDGFVEQAKYDPHEIQDCSVTVEIEMARDRKEQASGRISYVSSLIDMRGRYLVRAEVSNRQEYGRWLLRHGMTAAMTIHLNTDSAGAVDVSRAQ
jgi:multidrug efflux pump subunit AcrA (membrane-fusion protein)